MAGIFRFFTGSFFYCRIFLTSFSSCKIPKLEWYHWHRKQNIMVPFITFGVINVKIICYATTELSILENKTWMFQLDFITPLLGRIKASYIFPAIRCVSHIAQPIPLSLFIPIHASLTLDFSLSHFLSPTPSFSSSFFSSPIPHTVVLTY